MKKLAQIFKKLAHVILFALGVIIALLLTRKKTKFKPSPDVEKLKSENERLKSEQAELEKKLERLKEEERKIESDKKFSDPDSAADFLSSVLKRIQDNSKK